MSALPPISDVNLLCNGQGIVDFNTQIPNRALDLSVTKKQLYGSQIAGASIDQRRLGTAKRMSAEDMWGRRSYRRRVRRRSYRQRLWRRPFRRSWHGSRSRLCGSACRGARPLRPRSLSSWPTLRVRRRLRRLVLRVPVLHIKLLSERVLMSRRCMRNKLRIVFAGPVSTSETRKLSPCMEIGRLWRAKPRTRRLAERSARQDWHADA